MTKEEIIKQFDINGVGAKGSLFGLPFTEQQSDIIVLPVPWEVTVSYAAGTARGPKAILDASPQLDLHLEEYPEFWKSGVFMEDISTALLEKSDLLREKTEEYIEWLENNSGLELPRKYENLLNEVNQECQKMIGWVKTQALSHLRKGKIVGLLGGDHSTPLGLLQALAEQGGSFGVLQIDAHADLRKAYEGFKYSHASIFYNALEEIPEISKLVQVGIRDYCKEEADYANRSEDRIVQYTDRKIKIEQFRGSQWEDQVNRIVSNLPDRVYISFDIDGLDPKLCPHTGTPVPGGLGFEEAVFLIRKIAQNGKKIIGFDLNEVAPGESGEWDANVGARLLYHICAYTDASQKEISIR
ncbi:MAG: agmatinase family protein [Cyclobacteriaceae bacterium]|nr:agmatinase family protein [Cyclobacteriaceae bacterium]MCH8516079.1 agmatinase family protein [Cyclobacteriaceae bacterium]